MITLPTSSMATSGAPERQAINKAAPAAAPMTMQARVAAQSVSETDPAPSQRAPRSDWSAFRSRRWSSRPQQRGGAAGRDHDQVGASQVLVRPVADVDDRRHGRASLTAVMEKARATDGGISAKHVVPVARAEATRARPGTFAGRWRSSRPSGIAGVASTDPRVPSPGVPGHRLVAGLQACRRSARCCPRAIPVRALCQ